MRGVDIVGNMEIDVKVYGGVYDGRNRLIVAAKSKKAAFEAISRVTYAVSYYYFSQHTSETGNDVELKVALAAPLSVFSASTLNRGRLVAEDYKLLPLKSTDAT